jgi:hypothetical protein
MFKKNLLRKVIVLGAVLGLFVAFGGTKTNAAGSVLSLQSPKSGTVTLGELQNIHWTSAGYPAKTVSVNLIRRVGRNPDRYVLVRKVADKTMNDGLATWVPARTDLGGNLILEIGCTPTAVACEAAHNTSNLLAVVDSGRYWNTASVFQAIEHSANK